MRTLRFAVAALVAGAALSACGSQDGTSTPTPTLTTGASPVTEQPSSPTPSTPPSGPTVGPSGSPTGAGTPTPSPPAGGRSLTGIVTSGVEPGCLLLDGYLLIGGPRDVLAVGARVTVSGRVVPDMMTTCQQGTPFVVESARRS
ncbi:hypothetical protein [Micromonospora sp. WMMD812]|uniref:hypothetical protein n=1 Tax=Micromonospora sp. WMMD812 TaxID=3015152 RepID=UPI00248C0CFC|nr:hypothetical protein [Micromonospora sp. WMMD812]WBB64973.1 hypothetical protein O7603_17240 [Micromonospora sp. WMMD812]